MQAGTRLDHYAIVEKIGEGGMGAVYRAQDTRLKREVAIKVLPPEVSADPERLARLEREAQLLASLNHPNVATIHGFGEADVEENGATQHVAYLAMELVEGESLYGRVAAGPIPWREAVQIAVGIAAGLEAAHERGIVHRDLKPANVHLASDGTVKVLDFGLAKAFDADGQSGSLELSASPTVAAATRTGMILGTAAYMSPEQARGKPVDKRADIWALGCVLYEMLTGSKSFEGDTVSDVLAAILKEQPDLEALPPIPGRLRALLERLLQKDPKDRMRDVGDVRLELAASLNERARGAGTSTGGMSPAVVAAAAAVALVAGLGAGWLLRPVPEAPEARVMLAPDSIAGAMDALAISPDGTLVAETTPSEGIRVRSLGDRAWRALPDTGGAFTLAFDAAGERLYFGRDNEILSVDVNGSSPLSEATFPQGAFAYALFRGLDGDIQASMWDGAPSLVRIPAGGGVEELWAPADEDDLGAGALVVGAQLSSDRWLAWQGFVSGADQGIRVVQPGQPLSGPIVQGYRQPLHLGDGEVLAVDDRGRLAWLRIDPATGGMAAPPVARVEGLTLLGGFAAAYDVSATGTLAYIGGEVAASEGETLNWIDRAGAATVASTRRDQYDIDSRVSPDGRFVALEIASAGEGLASVQIHDFERDVRTTLTPGIRAAFPVWAPDGRRVAVLLDEGAETPGIYVVPVDRSAPPELLVPHPEGLFALPMDWSPDGAALVFVRSSSQVRAPDAQNDIWQVPAGGGEPEPLLATGASEIDPRISPDGRWLAYVSDQSGQYEVYLRPYAGGGETRVSAEGGSNPEWSPRGDELFFLRGNRAIYSVEVRDDPAQPVGAERPVVEIPGNARVRLYIPGPDGQRFLVSLFGGERGSNTVEAILNWRRNPR